MICGGHADPLDYVSPKPPVRLISRQGFIYAGYFEGWDSAVVSIVGLFNESLIDRGPQPYPPLFSQ
jgi:hypothetical protein